MRVATEEHRGRGQARGGGAVDGVLAIDPVALSYLMKGAPALDVDGVSIDAGNVVKKG